MRLTNSRIILITLLICRAAQASFYCSKHLKGVEVKIKATDDEPARTGKIHQTCIANGITTHEVILDITTEERSWKNTYEVIEDRKEWFNEDEIMIDEESLKKKKKEQENARLIRLGEEYDEEMKRGALRRKATQKKKVAELNNSFNSTRVPTCSQPKRKVCKQLIGRCFGNAEEKKKKSVNFTNENETIFIAKTGNRKYKSQRPKKTLFVTKNTGRDKEKKHKCHFTKDTTAADIVEFYDRKKGMSAERILECKKVGKPGKNAPKQSKRLAEIAKIEQMRKRACARFSGYNPQKITSPHIEEWHKNRKLMNMCRKRQMRIKQVDKETPGI